MPSFPTPEPIRALVEMSIGDLRVTASDRTDTVVEVRPNDPGHDADVRAAEQTTVEFAAGRLTVRTPKNRGLSLFSKPGSVEIVLDLPNDSELHATAAAGTVRTVGRLGDTRAKTAAGDIDIDIAADLELTSSAGDLRVGTASGRVEMSTSNGKIRLGEAGGDAVLKTANGEITVDAARGGLRANTANGDVRVGDLTRGQASLKTHYGEIEIGIHPGTAARLDLHTMFGRVHSGLAATDGPDGTDETVDVQARTSYGDILVRRS